MISVKKEEVKYVGFYNIHGSKSKRIASLPGVKKMDYVSEAITRAGFSVNIISPSWMSKESTTYFESQRSEKKNIDLTVTFTPSWKHKTQLGRYLKILVSIIWLFFYLIFTTKKDEKVIVYHAQLLSLPIILAKKIKKFHLVLEVEEIYSEVWKTSKLLNRMEELLLNNADSYIFVSDKLQKRFLYKNKESIVLYGAYERIDKFHNEVPKDNLTHIIYAGSIDLVKGGAFNAIKIIRELPNCYKLHLLGGGREEDIKLLEESIALINKEKKYDAIVYNGILRGAEFKDYLSKCDIALNPQNEGGYMNTAFPSKIITYLSHNLRVISTPIESIKMSKVSSYINFTESSNSGDFAKEIIELSLPVNKSDTNIIKKLDKEFVDYLKLLLQKNDFKDADKIGEPNV